MDKLDTLVDKLRFKIPNITDEQIQKVKDYINNNRTVAGVHTTPTKENTLAGKAIAEYFLDVYKKFKGTLKGKKLLVTLGLSDQDLPNIERAVDNNHHSSNAVMELAFDNIQQCLHILGLPNLSTSKNNLSNRIDLTYKKHILRLKNKENLFWSPTIFQGLTP